MSLQALNEDYQLELAQKHASKKPSNGAFGKLRMNHFGIFRGTDYPDEKRLEELLLSFE